MPVSEEAREKIFDKLNQLDEILDQHARKTQEKYSQFEEALRLKEQECEELRRELEVARIRVEELERG